MFPTCDRDFFIKILHGMIKYFLTQRYHEFNISIGGIIVELTFNEILIVLNKYTSKLTDKFVFISINTNIKVL